MQEGRARGPMVQEGPPDPSQDDPILAEGEAGRVPSSQPLGVGVASNQHDGPSPSPPVPSQGEEVPVDPSQGVGVLGRASLGVAVLLDPSPDVAVPLDPSPGAAVPLDPSPGAAVLWGPMHHEEEALSAPILQAAEVLSDPILRAAEGLSGPSHRAAEAIHQAVEGPSPQEVEVPSQVDPCQADVRVH